MVINIRGTNGSGKSSVVCTVREQATVQPIYDVQFGLRHPEAYRLTFSKSKTPTYVIGPYETPCGGCDAVQPYALLMPLIEKYAAHGHLLFEGSLVSSCWGAIGELLERHAPDALVLFLDTPVNVCVERVTARRLERGDQRPFDPKGLIAKHRTIARIKQKIQSAGLVRTVSASSEDAPAVIVQFCKRE